MRPSMLRSTSPRSLRLAIVALGFAIAASPVGAQVPIPGVGEEDVEEQAAALALNLTPIGALPVSAASGALGLGPQQLGFRFHVGQLDHEGDLTTRGLAAGIDIPLSRATLGLTVGVLDVGCDIEDIETPDFSLEIDCNSLLMAGANVAIPLMTTPMSASGDANASTFAMGLDFALGIASGDMLEIRVTDPEFGTVEGDVSASSLSFAAALPLAFIVRTPGVMVIPHLRPGIGYGNLNMKIEGGGEEEEIVDDGSMRFMVGGGVGLKFTQSNFGIDLGFQKVFVEDGKTTIGLGITFGR